MKVYEPTRVLCEICTVKESTVMPLCVIEDERKFVHVCFDCRDKVPYPVIPIVTVLDKGYYFAPNIPDIGTAGE